MSEGSVRLYPGAVRALELSADCIESIAANVRLMNEQIEQALETSEKEARLLAATLEALDRQPVEKEQATEGKKKRGRGRPAQGGTARKEKESDQEIGQEDGEEHFDQPSDQDEDEQDEEPKKSRSKNL